MVAGRDNPREAALQLRSAETGRLDDAPSTRHEHGVEYVQRYRECGFAVVRRVFDSRDVAELAGAFDAMWREGARHPATFRNGNLCYVVDRDARGGPLLRFVQWPSYVNPVLAAYRTDRRLLRLLEPLIGRNLKQVTNSIIWKRPGVADTAYAYHQDCRFRRPASAFRDRAGSMVQTAIAVDAHRPDSGCMRMCPGSHRRGNLRLGVTHGVYDAACDEAELRAAGCEPSAVVDVLLDPGDVALWHPYTVHGSHANRSAGDRRSYLNGYVVADNADRGEWAFRDGEPCALGAPVLVQYDALFTRPEPHYVDGRPHPFERE